MAKKEETALTLEDVQAQITAMLEEAKAEAKRIVADARAEAEGKATAEEAAAKAAKDAEAAAAEELVEVKLFKDNDKYKDPVFVGVNGETVAIERGVRVKVKRKFAEVLDNSDKQDYDTSKLIEQKSNEWAKSGL